MGNVAAVDPTMKAEYNARINTGNILMRNLITSLSSASSYQESSESSMPVAKKQKVEGVTNGTTTANNGDVYQILDPSFTKANGGTSELAPGAIVSRLTLGGLVNALAGVAGGVVDTVTCIPLSDLEHEANTGGTKKEEGTNKGIDVIVESAGKLSLKEVIGLGRGLHRSIAAR